MSTTVDIPGGTATIRDRLVTERQRRPIKRAAVLASASIALLAVADLPEIPEDGTDEEKAKAEQERAMAVLAVGISDAEADAMLAMEDATIVAYLESWTLERPLPTMDSVQDLDPDLYDALAQATRPARDADKARPALDFGPNPEKIDPATGEERPFGDLSASTSPSSGSPPSPSTSTQPSDGAPTPGASSTPAQ